MSSNLGPTAIPTDPEDTPQRTIDPSEKRKKGSTSNNFLNDHDDIQENRKKKLKQDSWPEETLVSSSLMSNSSTWLEVTGSTSNSEQQLHDPQSVVLRISAFDEWTAHQIASLLCMPMSKGGASLEVPDIQLLYCNGFNGACINNILLDIKRDMSIAHKNMMEDFPQVSSRVCRTIINWVICTLKERLVNLWTETDVKSKLCQPKSKGGIDLSMDQVQMLYEEKLDGTSLSMIMKLLQVYNNLSSVDIMKQVLKKDINSSTCTAVLNWVNDNLLEKDKIQVVLQNVELLSRGIDDHNDDSWLQNQILSLNMASQLEMVNRVEKIYHEALMKITKHLDQKLFDLSAILAYKPTSLHVGTIESSIPPYVSHLCKNKMLPVSRIDNKYTFRKHYLPYIPSLQITTSQEQFLSVENKEAYIILSPSGIGKTSLLIRTLSKYPGLLLTGTASYEGGSRQTTDAAVQQLMALVNGQSRTTSFGCVRQVIQLLLISKLLHVICLIEEAQKNNDVLKPFGWKILPYLAFNQSNGNTTQTCRIFVELSQVYQYTTNLPQLREITRKLIQFVKQMIFTNFSDQLPITHVWNKSNDLPFLICVDEANILEETCIHKYLSCRGNERGVLSVMAGEIESLKNDNISSFYAGTNVSIDISQIVQSNLMKTEAKSIVHFITQFEYLNKTKFINYLTQHITVDPAMENEINNLSNSFFPIRIRQAALFLENYLNRVLNKEKIAIADCFSLGMESARMEIERNVNNFFTAIPVKHREAYINAFSGSLFQYIIHHMYHDILGYYFVERNQYSARNLLVSGLTCPTNEAMTEFEAKDALGFQTAQLILRRFNAHERIQPYELAKQLLDITHTREKTEVVVGLHLLSCDGKQLDELFSNLPNTMDGSTIFHCTKLLSPNSYKQYCIEKWNETKVLSGEELFISHIRDKQWDFLNGIAFMPSHYFHPDIIVFFKGKSGEIINFNISVKMLSGKEMKQDKGYKSTITKLMFLNNYKQVDLSTIQNLKTAKFSSSVELLNFLNGSNKKDKKNIHFPENSFWSASFGQIMESLDAVKTVSVLIHLHNKKDINLRRKDYQDCLYVDQSSAEQFFGKALAEGFKQFLTKVEQDESRM
ncbi:hypothetical protein C9374_011751 [Naegleria lovaniensis]|uniref:Uncharacterized protein n=1 Tax=Naegleria lovaniensis TaxID=51637 RepID=A0AA88KF85_NAELO|nr:uncharacterized protein C9374_011751 [Naegleria lovaniensis]KAG2373866.1 hypothetical protein C9374_011751 [Naegleria lovaniensis]